MPLKLEIYVWLKKTNVRQLSHFSNVDVPTQLYVLLQLKGRSSIIPL